jgi:cysteinyl-tRNA synthetase
MRTEGKWTAGLAMAVALSFSCGAQSVDPKGAMVAFVEAVAAHARAAEPGFGVFPQNAAELGQDPGYLATVTGIGQEDAFYGYQGPGKKTPEKVTEQIESDLDRFEAAGKLVLTVDYPFRNRNKPAFSRSVQKKIDRLYSLSAERGYVPYATVLNLDWLTMNPGHAPSANHGGIAEWSQVTSFAYQLQPSRGQSRSGFLAALGAAGYDLLVLDYSFDGSDAEAFTPAEIADLKAQCGGKLLAYVSIGEAEDYRWYWNQAWDANHDGKPDPGAPAWLGPENPQWPGDYRVRFWDPAWQAIVFQYVDKVMAQGFDGVYLDTVDTYEYWERHPSKLQEARARPGQNSAVETPALRRNQREP